MVAKGPAEDREPASEMAGPREADVLELAADPAVLERLAADSSITEARLEPDSEALVLNLEDLLPDMEGEVVLYAEVDVPLSLVAERPLTGSGIVEHHVTAAGVDVDGLYYYSFDNGITLYSDIDILIVDA